jgi:uncharacterized protein YukE
MGRECGGGKMAGFETPEEFEAVAAPFIDKIDTQARDLGAKNERIEALNRVIHDQAETIQALKGDVATATHEVTEAFAREKMARESLAIIAKENRELENTVRLLEQANTTLRAQLAERQSA